MHRAGWLLAGVVLAGCGGSSASVGPLGEPEYACGSLTFSAEELAAALPADDLGADGQAALEGHAMEPIDPGEGWRLLAETGSELELIRELDKPEQGGPGDVRSHEFLRVHTVTGVTNVPDGGWVLDAQGLCTPRLDLGSLGPADLALAEPASPDAQQIALEVYERACAGGRPADGRVEIVEQELSDEQLRLVVGVQHQDGDHTCPSNPPTPLTIQLDEPLGDRTVVDASTLPPQPLQPSPVVANS